jgi:hypothetical protein
MNYDELDADEDTTNHTTGANTAEYPVFYG